MPLPIPIAAAAAAPLPQWGGPAGRVTGRPLSAPARPAPARAGKGAGEWEREPCAGAQANKQAVTAAAGHPPPAGTLRARVAGARRGAGAPPAAWSAQPAALHSCTCRRQRCTAGPASALELQNGTTTDGCSVKRRPLAGVLAGKQQARQVDPTASRLPARRLPRTCVGEAEAAGAASGRGAGHREGEPQVSQVAPQAAIQQHVAGGKARGDRGMIRRGRGKGRANEMHRSNPKQHAQQLFPPAA